MGFGNVFAAVMMFVILAAVLFTFTNINKQAMVENSDLIKMKQKNMMEKNDQEISIVLGKNFTVFRQYSINLTNTGSTIIPISELSFYLSNRKIPDEDISSVGLVNDVVNPGLWDPSEIIRINFTATRSSGIHTFKVTTGQGMTESTTLSFTTCKSAQPYYPNNASLNYTTIVKSNGAWETTIQLNQLTAKDNYILSGSGFNDNHGACTNTYVGSTTVANPYRRSLVWVNTDILPEDVSISKGIFSWFVYALQTAGGSNHRVNVSRMTENWTEGTGSCTDNNNDVTGSTWNTYDGANAWQTAGGTHDTTPLNNSVVSAINQWMNFDISNLTMSWYNGTYPNYGILTKTVGEGTLIQTRVLARSSEYATVSVRPRLNVTYNPYCFDITVVN